MTKKKVIVTSFIVLTLLIVSVVFLCTMNNKSIKAQKMIKETKINTIKEDSIDLNLSSDYWEPERFEIALNSSASDVLGNYLEKFSASLNNFSGNGSYLYYQDNGDIPSMEGYAKGVGYIKGMRETTCGEGYSSWVYTINDEYFSRIILSTEKLDGYKLSPSNSNYYYQANSYKGNIKIPNFSLNEEREIETNYQEFKEYKSNIAINIPEFDSKFQYFEGASFEGLDTEPVYLTGISNSNYNNEFSSKNFENLLLSDFKNIWHVKSSSEDAYLLSGRLADIQLKKLLSMMFEEVKECDDFSELIRNPKEICSSLDSYYSTEAIKSQFFEFEIDCKNYSTQDSSFVRVFDYNRWCTSIIKWELA